MSESCSFVAAGIWLGTAPDHLSRSAVAITEDAATCMNKIIRIAPGFAVTSAMEPDDFAQAAALGFRAIINNRPDGEDPHQLTAADEALHAASAGMGYAHVPASKLELFSDSVVEPMQRALAELDRPILAHCQYGVRSAIAWAAVSARERPVEAVLAHLKEAGFDLEFLHDDLDAQADRARWNEPSRRTATTAVTRRLSPSAAARPAEPAATVLPRTRGDP